MRLLLLLLFSFAVGQTAQAQRFGTCNPEFCRAPDCVCPSSRPPGNLPLEDVPQFVLVTIDDCVNQPSLDVIFDTFGAVRNPNGRPVPITFFTSIVGCPFGPASSRRLADSLHRAGHEIAVHTYTHTTSTSTSFNTWREELMGVRRFIDESGIPRDRLGFRAPFTNTNPDLYRVLQSQNFLYDSSLFEEPFHSRFSLGPANYIWPHTMDYGPAQQCSWTTDNFCPEEPMPGLWTVPIYYHVNPSGEGLGPQDYFGAFDIGDPRFSHSREITNREELIEIMYGNFLVRYRNNKAPYPMYMHAPGLVDPYRRGTIRIAAEIISRNPGVWFVTMKQLIAWMQQPVAVQYMTQFLNGQCTGPGTCGLVSNEAEVCPDVLELTTHPNPVRDFVLVRASQSLPGESRLQVSDMGGRFIMEVDAPSTAGEAATISLRDVPAGPNMVRLLHEGRPVAQRMVIKN